MINARGLEPARRVLRTCKTLLANHLGLPLPSGSVEVYVAGRAGSHSCNTNPSSRTSAVDQEVELDLGTTPDVEVRGAGRLGLWADSAHAKHRAVGAGRQPALA